MFTKKVKITWQTDRWLNFGPTDRAGNQATAMAEFDVKTTAMMAEGKMDDRVSTKNTDTTLTEIRYFTDQAEAEGWIAFNDTFAAKYGFVKLNSAIINL